MPHASSNTAPLTPSQPHESVRSETEAPTIVLTSAVPWDGIVARPQHFARGLAQRGWNVLFVDGPITWLSPLKNRSLWNRTIPRTPVRTIAVEKHRDSHQDSPSESQGQARDNPQNRVLVDAQPGFLRVLSPVANLPFGNVERPINHINQRLLALQITHAAPGPYILLSMLPGSADLIPHLHPLACLYDCVDLHAQFSGFVHPRLVEQMEQDMVNVSRTVFATASNLYESMQRWHADVRLLPNAAEVDHFATTKGAQVHPLIRDLPQPRVTMFGGLGSWIDQAFLCDLADTMPELQVLLVGPIETDVSRLRAKPNIHLLGRQPYADLPQFLAGSDATLIAFDTDNKVAQSVNPIKVYEYLAADREVIATPIPELKKLSDSLWITDSGQTAAAALRRILSGERRMNNAADRAGFVAQNSWDARVDVIDEQLHRVLPGYHSDASHGQTGDWT